MLGTRDGGGAGGAAFYCGFVGGGVVVGAVGLLQGPQLVGVRSSGGAPVGGDGRCNEIPGGLLDARHNHAGAAK
eukprot:647400-Prymnesium_polylepis.1